MREREVVISYNGQERLRFKCRDFGEQGGLPFLVTGRHHKAPPTPVGSAVNIDGELVGYVVAVSPATLSDRYNVSYAPVVFEAESPGEALSAIGPELLAEGERGLDIPVPDVPPAATSASRPRRRSTRKKPG